MSVAPTLIECEQCDFSTSTSVLWGHFSYVAPEGHFNVGRTLGWCANCADLVPMERLGDPDQLKEELLEAEQAMVRLRDGWLRQWILCLFSYWRNAIACQAKQIAALGFALALAEQRAGTECCLQCGSRKVTEVDLPEDNGWMLFRHPGCDGALRTTLSDVRFSIRFEERLFDRNGMPHDPRPRGKITRAMIEYAEKVVEGTTPL